MKHITAIVIDDEEHNRNVLRTSLSKHCPNIILLGEAANADDAFQLITTKKPQLVFLDVRMPEKSGFDLLKMFEVIDFEVVFVSAFNEYAISAFDFNALGYILKPIDYNKLITCVDKAIKKIEKNIQSPAIVQFIQTIETGSDSITKMAIHHNEKVLLVNISNLISIQSDDGICKIDLVGNKNYYSSKDLKLFEGMLKEVGNFIRVNKNAVINLDHLKSYRKGEVCILQMVNDKEFEVSRRKKVEVLSRIKIL